MVNKISILFQTKDPKLRKSDLQMVTAILIKVLSMGISFATVPLILNFISYEKYGVYLALTSSFALINIMDIGLGDGLRNKFAECQAQGNTEMARIYVSTTYFSNLVLSLLIISLYFLFEHFINWNEILQVSEEYGNLKLVARILIIATALKFFLQAILNILKGDQKYTAFLMIGFFLNLISVLLIFIFITLNFTGSLLLLVFAFFVFPNLALIAITIFYFTGSYVEVFPKFSFIKGKILKSLSALSLKFFVVNIMSVVALQSINLIVIRYFDANLVVDFNLLFKYYFLLISVAYMLFNPIWSTFTEAIIKKDAVWTQKLLNRTLKLSFLLALLIPIMILVANIFISFWIDTDFNSSTSTNFLFGIWAILTIVCEPYKMLLKGSGELNSYMLVSIIFTVLQILLSLVLIEFFGLRLNAILIGCIVSQLFYFFFFYLSSLSLLRELKTL